jgi:hypothetical protein
VPAVVAWVVLASAHLGLFLLLTTEARSEQSRLEARYGRDRLLDAQDPGSQPTDAEGHRPWARARDLWEGAEAWRRHGLHRRAVRTGLVVSFLVWTGVIGILAARAGHRRRLPRVARRGG